MSQVSLSEIAVVFLRLGAIGFGGPIALIALMETECVRHRKWFPLEDFHEAFVFCKMLPGPVAYQMALWTGQRVRGAPGALIAGSCFLLPGSLLVLLLSALYSQVTGLSYWQSGLAGLRVGALAVIILSVIAMAKPIAKSPRSWAIAVGAFGALFLFPHLEPLIILFGGILSIVLVQRLPITKKVVALPILWELFWVHFKAGAFVFGTGLAIIPMLQESVVNKRQWLSLPAFIDGIAIGQVTPGPITITSVFIGDKVAGIPGALAALLGMYSPGIVLILVLLPWLRRKLERKPWLKDFQTGAVAAVIGCLFTATIWLGQSAVTSWQTGILFLVLLAIALKTKLPAWVLIPLGSLLAVFVV